MPQQQKRKQFLKEIDLVSPSQKIKSSQAKHKIGLMGRTLNYGQEFMEDIIKFIPRAYGYCKGRAKATLLFIRKKINPLEFQGKVESQETKEKMYEAGEKMSMQGEMISEEAEAILSKEENQ